MMNICLVYYYYVSLASLVVVSGLSSDGQTLLSLSTGWVSSSPSLLSSWNASHVDPCLWVGVVCDPANLQVVALDLSDSQISGEVGPEISHLSQLKSLNLSFNDFSGPIPSQIGNCTRLQYLDLSVNSLSGNIPNTLGNLLTLKHLNLGTNSLNGSIPEYIFHIPTLEILALSLNRLTGFIPSNLGMQPCSKNYANSAGLEGQIPLGYGGCKKLNYLDLSFNQVVSLPPQLGNCTNLEQFAVVGSG
ncbi:receptor-like protein kinase [Tanacetum coccineum]